MRLVLCAVLLTALPGYGQAPAGRWDGALSFGKVKVPFTLEFQGTADKLTASLVNGDSRIHSTSGSLDNKTFRLAFASLGTRFEASMINGELKGTYHARDGAIPFTASAYCTCEYEGEPGPETAGVWQSPDSGWRLQIRRKGEDTLATLSHASGEAGPFWGRFDGAVFNLHYFDGVRAALLEIELRKDNAIDVTLTEPGQDIRKFKATRAAKVD